jgi:hypothetical protein
MNDFNDLFPSHSVMNELGILRKNNNHDNDDYNNSNNYSDDYNDNNDNGYDNSNTFSQFQSLPNSPSNMNSSGYPAKFDYPTTGPTGHGYPDKDKDKPQWDDEFHTIRKGANEKYKLKLSGLDLKDNYTIPERLGYMYICIYTYTYICMRRVDLIHGEISDPCICAICINIDIWAHMNTSTYKYLLMFVNVSTIFVTYSYKYVCLYLCIYVHDDNNAIINFEFTDEIRYMQLISM